jgi:threonine/homoserine/homoserine lactone efflux protein
MALESYITFFIVSLIISSIPGPTILLVTHYALQYGRWAGRFTIPAVIFGDLVALILTFIGLEVLLKIHPESLTILKLIGGIYLIILGVSSIFSKKNIEEENKASKKPPGRRIFTHVFIITAFNPKTIIFFLAFFSQFTNPMESMLSQFLIMGVTYTILGALTAIMYDLAAHKISVWITNPVAKRIIHVITGCLLCGLGITTIFL